MDWQLFGTMAAGLIASLGGFEAVKWLINRKANKRVADAKAENEEIKTDSAEFHLLKEQTEMLVAMLRDQIAAQHGQIKYLNEQLVKKEDRGEERSQVIRQLNKEKLEMAKEMIANERKYNDELNKQRAQITDLLVERSQKLCQVKSCPKREPQSGY